MGRSKPGEPAPEATTSAKTTSAFRPAASKQQRVEPVWSSPSRTSSSSKLHAGGVAVPSRFLLPARQISPSGAAVQAAPHLQQRLPNAYCCVSHALRTALVYILHSFCAAAQILVHITASDHCNVLCNPDVSFTNLSTLVSFPAHCNLNFVSRLPLHL